MMLWTELLFLTLLAYSHTYLLSYLFTYVSRCSWSGGGS